jgi:RimJ/RimL family protein N-acetyltransferase
MKFVPTDFDAMARLFPQHELIVIEIDNEIAGTIGYSQKDVRVFGLECKSIFGFDLRINPRFWRRGIGFHVCHNPNTTTPLLSSPLLQLALLFVL